MREAMILDLVPSCLELRTVNVFVNLATLHPSLCNPPNSFFQVGGTVALATHQVCGDAAGSVRTVSTVFLCAQLDEGQLCGHNAQQLVHISTCPVCWQGFGLALVCSWYAFGTVMVCFLYAGASLDAPAYKSIP